MLNLTLALGNRIGLTQDIAGFIIEDDGLSSSYRINLTLCLNEFIAPNEMIGSEVLLTLEQSGVSRCFPGIVIDVAITQLDRWFYELVIGSPLERLQGVSQQRVFVQESVSDIIKKVLSPLPVTFHLSNPAKQPSMIIQYGETDQQFLWRLLAVNQFFLLQVGEYYQVYDDFNALSADPLVMAYHRQSGLYPVKNHVFEWNRQETLDQSFWVAKSDTLDQSFWVAKSDTLALKPGLMVDIDEQRYRITSIKHYYKAGFYHNHATCVPSDQVPEFSAKQPIFNGVMPCHVVSGDHNPYLDDSGNYRVHYPFDNRAVGWEQRSAPVGSLQMTAGEHAKIHFPYSPGSQVGVMAMAGQLEKAVILGALGNSEQALPVTSDNPLQTRLVGKMGYALLMDDGENEKLKLSNKDDSQHIALQQSQDDWRMDVDNQAGDIQISSDKDFNIHTERSVTQKIGNNYEAVVNNGFELMCDEMDLRGRQIDLSGGSIAWDVKGDMIIQSHGDSDFVSNKQLDVNVSKGDLKLHCSKGDFILQAQDTASIISLDDGCLHLQTPKASITLENDTIALNGENITIEAASIDMGGESYIG